MTSEEKAQLIALAADAKQARDMVLLDLDGLTIMTDYFFLCCGNSTTHVRSITDNIVETIKKNGGPGIHPEGYNAATWILLDYGDVVVHIMSPEMRDYYQIEEFWNQAPRVVLDLPTPA